jgi:hypothetical protein
MRSYLQISGTVFGIVALAHVLRVIQRWPAAVAGWAVPMWVSVVAALVTGVLAIWAFRAAARGRSWLSSQ